ncbi:hypothetical protein MMC17_010259 [Xylographa soralifera]|nr:hypothetical protein [Xylographa soralifera]
MDASQLVRKHLAENIILLRSLNKVPGEVKECDLPAENQSRQLSIAREKQLGDDFAFLSATTDNMSRVMAVGIEEDDGGTGMTIRLASNTGDLSRIREEFRKIGDILQEAASRTSARAELKPKLLEQIVVMDYARILSRLRSRHANRTRKTQGKQPLITLLSREINDPSIVLSNSATNIQLSEIRSRVRELLGMFERLELHSREAAGLDSHHNTIMEIVEKAHEMIHQFDLGAILRTSSTCNPSFANALPKSLGKVGRYYSVSGALIDAARNPKYRVFNHIKVEILEPPTISWSFISQQALSFDQTLQRISNISVQSRKVASARQEFESRASDNCPSPWLVHSEIQLLVFYESNKTVRPPRMLCSSKSSCYLCHLYITTHGRFYVPSTHGTIYDRWMLSEWSSSSTNNVISQLNVMIENRIRYFLENENLTFIHPNESVLRAYTPWSSFTTLSHDSMQPTLITSRLSKRHSFIHDLETTSFAGIASASTRYQQQNTSEPNPEALERSIQDPGILEDANATVSRLVEEQKTLQELEVSATVVDVESQLYQQQDLNRSRTLSHTSASTTCSQLTLRPARASSSSLELDHTQMPSDDRISNGSVDFVEDKHPAFINLARDTWNCFKLLPPDYCIKLRTDRVHLQLASERKAGMESVAAQTEPTRDCWVGVKWIHLNNNPGSSHETLQHFDLDLLGRDDKVVEAGPDVHAEPLCLRRRNDLVAIKFAFDGPPPELNVGDYENGLRV